MDPNHWQNIPGSRVVVKPELRPGNVVALVVLKSELRPGDKMVVKPELSSRDAVALVYGKPELGPENESQFDPWPRTIPHKIISHIRITRHCWKRIGILWQRQ